MSLLAIPIVFVFLISGTALDISSDHLLLIMAIIVAGGLAGGKD